MNKGENTKQYIIETSAALFNKMGYSGCSLSDIMKATGLKKGGIYNHFENKDEIALAAFDWAYNQVFKRFRERLSKDSTPTQKIESIIFVMENYVNDPVVEGGCPIMNSAMDANTNNPALMKKAREGVNTFHKYVSIKIEEGKATGEFRKNVDSDQFATLLISTLEGALIMSKATGQQRHMKTSATFVRDYIKNNLLPG